MRFFDAHCVLGTMKDTTQKMKKLGCLYYMKRSHPLRLSWPI